MAAQIVISYRGHHTLKDGQGMLYDHACFQTATSHPTARSQPSAVNEKVTRVFTSAVTQYPASLSMGVQNKEGKKIPPTISNSTTGGLLVIPGRVRATEDEPVRLEHEKGIIREARKRGQPILAICAGAWRVWKQIVGDVQDEVIEVKDHNYSGGMLRLDGTGMNTTYNVQIHDITVEKDSLLESAMKVKDVALPSRISVNSVHWKAVNHTTCPANFRISAWSQENASFHRKNRQGEEMHPQANTPEAFESTLGAPILGIQWHAEGYSAKDNSLHLNLLRYMAKAGDAYHAKQQVLPEIREKFARSQVLLELKEKFSKKNNREVLGFHINDDNIFDP